MRLKTTLPPHRETCLKCRKAQVTCYCAALKPFTAPFQFVVLIHPREARMSIGTGRMTHRSLTNSQLIEGENFSNDERVNAILKDPANFSVVLYPGPSSLDLSRGGREKIAALVPSGKNLVVFVIDGTWQSAKRMLRESVNLQTIPTICFTPPHPSNYQIRKQPDFEVCFSTIEAVHFIIDSLNPENQTSRNLLDVFQFMVRQQIDYASESGCRSERKARVLDSRP